MNKIDKRGWVEIVVLCVLTVVIWVKSLPHEAPVAQWNKAATAPEVVYVDREIIVPKKVIVYVDRAKDALALPPAITADPNEHVLQAVELVASDHPQQVVCTQNSTTGESTLSFRLQPMPWFAAENVATVRADYGLRNGTRVGRLSGTWDVVAIKDWDVGVGAALYSDTTAFFGLGASVKF